jgi:hypothetical protein
VTDTFHRDLARAYLGREVSSTSVRVLHLTVPTEEEFPAIPEGTIALFGAHDAKELDRIAQAVEASDLRRLRELLDKNREQFRKVLVSDTRIYASLDDVPIFADFRYGGSTVLNAMFVPPKVAFASSRILYSGAEIDPGEFRLVRRARTDADQEMYGLAVVRDIVLTDLERTVLSRLSADQVQLTFSPGGEVYFIPAVVAAAAWLGEAAAAAAVGWAVGKALDAAWDWAFGDLMERTSREQYLRSVGDQRLIGRVDPTLAVSQLLRLRADSLRAPTERTARREDDVSDRDRLR